MKRRYLCFIGLLLLSSGAFAQYSIPVRFIQDSSRTTTVGAFLRGPALYASLSDLIVTLKLSSYVNSETNKLEFHADGYTVKVTANNPFVVVTDKETNASILQLPTNVLFAANSFFVPVEAFVPIIDDVLPATIAFSEPDRQIVVGRLVRKSPYDITGLQVEEKSNGYLITLSASKKLVDYESWMKPIGKDTWLYVTIADAKADVNAFKRIKPTDILKKVMVFQSPTSVQLTFKLKGHITNTELIQAEGSDDILIALHTPVMERVEPEKPKETPRTTEKEKNRWLLDCIVIDAGHGGDDPGTIGVLKTKEKDIALAIALKLGKLIEKRVRDVKVIYTRTNDEFIELDRRGQIANAAGGKLFISIHCNAMPHKPNETNGFEIYLLRPGKTENAIRIAERENSVVQLEKDYEKRYQQLTEEHFILLTMAQSAYVKYSEQFADILQQEMGKHTDVENNGVKQAGFYVLVGASMPNVLVEAGYLSNKHDEKILRTQKGQQSVAEAIFAAVMRYKQEYDKSLEEGTRSGSSQ